MLLTLALAAASPTAAASEAEMGLNSITLSGTELRASEIAVVPAELDTVIARLPKARVSVVLAEADRVALLRSRYPGARYRLRHAGALQVRYGPDRAAASAVCATTVSPLAAGDYVEDADLVRTACSDAPTGGLLGYDNASRAYFARHDIPSGTNLGGVRTTFAPAVSTGARLTYRTSEGPVIVEREVVALQPAREGRRVFVRTEDGEVIAAPVQFMPK